METRLLIIDAQNDFCHPEGALYVPGAEADMARLADFIADRGESFSRIHLSLDTHHYVDVGHPVFWVDPEGNHPQPLSVLSPASVKSGQWRPADPELEDWAIRYVEALAAHDRYSLTIWPYHCLIGSWGHALYPRLFEALSGWEARFGNADYLLKGFNMRTEHYSAVQADVPDPEDPDTELNSALIKSLKHADRILVAGEALNICVANTVQDIADHIGEAHIPKITLLEDASSPVPGEAFEALTRRFLEKMKQRGMQTARTTDP